MCNVRVSFHLICIRLPWSSECLLSAFSFKFVTRNNYCCSICMLVTMLLACVSFHKYIYCYLFYRDTKQIKTDDGNEIQIILSNKRQIQRKSFQNNLENIISVINEIIMALHPYASSHTFACITMKRELLRKRMYRIKQNDDTDYLFD